MGWRASFVQALEKVDPRMAVTIEPEDSELGQIEGLELATRTQWGAAGR